MRPKTPPLRAHRRNGGKRSRYLNFFRLRCKSTCILYFTETDLDPVSCKRRRAHGSIISRLSRKGSITAACSPNNMGPLRPVLLDQVTPPNPVPTLGLLKRTDCQVNVAENSHIGVEKFNSVRYDLVRMDIEMAVMDACTAAREIRNGNGKGSVPSGEIQTRGNLLDQRRHRQLHIRTGLFQIHSFGADSISDAPQRKALPCLTTPMP